MKTTDTLIIGAGQAGLALSHCLTSLGRDHTLIERGRLAERWRSERWDSLRLLTPNWMTRLPGYSYEGPDPDGFMTARDAVDFFDGYAASFGAPVQEHTTVERVAACGDQFIVETDQGAIRSRSVVIATGWCDRPAVPAFAHRLSPRIHQVVPSGYRRPDDLPPGGVLVVGASATGVQLAHELHLSGRPVVISVGSHSRMPRTYRGMDAFFWLQLIGSLDKTIDHVADIAAARREPSLQLVGRPDHSTLDLGVLQQLGVQLVGRLVDVDGSRATFAPDLADVTVAADKQMNAVLTRVDRAIERLGLTSEVLAPKRPRPVVPAGPLSHAGTLDLAADGITSVVWATGHRRSYDWLELPVIDRTGEITQYRGVTPMPGVYVLGQRFQHSRSSNFIDGVGRDAAYVATHLCASLQRFGRSSAVATPHPK